MSEDELFILEAILINDVLHLEDNIKAVENFKKIISEFEKFENGLN